MSWVFGSFIRHIIAPQAHFRKVTVHVVGKSGCVLHARDHDRSEGCLGSSSAKLRPGRPPKVGM